MAGTGSEFEPIVSLFLSGRMPGMNHARHVALARVFKTLPFGRELLHLGLQVTATRAGVPQKYDRALTDAWWDRIEGAPSLRDFADVPGVSQAARADDTRAARNP